MIFNTSLSCEQLEERLAALHQVSLELVQDISLDSLLQRIARIACEQAGAGYAAISIHSEDGGTERFISVGLNAEGVTQLPHPPINTALMTAIAESQGPVRVMDIQTDANRAGNASPNPG
jgi:two-component system, NarL family, sensor histidine kinase DevS